MSPYVDLTLSGSTMDSKRTVDPLFTRELIQARVSDYTAGQDAALGLISPIFADLSGLPPLIIQAGSHEVLLDDAVRLARQAATADVEVTLEITPWVLPRLPGLSRDPRRGDRGAGQRRTAPIGASHRRQPVEIGLTTPEPDDARSMRRAGVDDAASFGPTGAPHSPQNRASASSGLPHVAQAAATTDPQWMQNLRPGRFSVPQLEQITLASPLHVRPGA